MNETKFLPSENWHLHSSTEKSSNKYYKENKEEQGAAMEGGAHWGVSVEQRHKCVKSTSQYISKGGKKARVLPCFWVYSRQSAKALRQKLQQLFKELQG